MLLVTSPEDILKRSTAYRRSGNRVGLVPTMGALHEGHLSLVRRSSELNDITIVSIFVNPLQFNNSADLNNYPRTLDSDLEMLEDMGVDYVFSPGEDDMYKSKPIIRIDFGELANRMEGEFRPGHFDGVGVVVAKLFHLCNPSSAFFGLKDLQQYLLVQKMVEELSFQIEVVGMPIIRETSGLAMSSRNKGLSDQGLTIAAKIFQGLKVAEESWKTLIQPDETKRRVISFYREISGLEIEYFQCVDPDTLQELTENKLQPVAFCVAGYVEGIRLIDNLYLRQD